MKKIILALALLPVVSFAQVTAPSSAFDTFMWQATGGAQQTISYGSNGTPVVSPANAVLSADGGLPKVTQSGSLKNPSGNAVPISVVSRVSGSKAAIMLIAGAKTLPFLGTGIAIYEVAKELGYDLMKAGGQTVITKPGVSSYNFSQPAGTLCYSGAGSNPDGSCPRTMVQYCNAATSDWTSIGAWNGFPNVCLRNGSAINVIQPPTGTCPAPAQIQPITGTTSWGRSGTEGGCYEMTVAEPVTVADSELADAIAAKSGWPSTSKIPQALVDAAAATGTKIQPDVGTVTGPATSVGKVTTTNNTTNNTTKTETVTHHHTYEGAKVNTSTTTVINVVDNSTGSTVSNETTTSTPEPLAEPAQDVCEKNPETIGCSKYGTPVASDELVKETVSVTITPVAFAGAATCPGPINFNVAGHQYAVEYSPLCDKLAVLKYLFLAMAGFVAAYVVASMFKV